MPLNRQSGITRQKGSSYVPEAVTMAQALELAEEAYRAKQEAAADVLRERERCAAICEEYPNLMAQHLAKRIRGGK